MLPVNNLHCVSYPEHSLSSHPYKNECMRPSTLVSRTAQITTLEIDMIDDGNQSSAIVFATNQMRIGYRLRPRRRRRSRKVFLSRAGTYSGLLLCCYEDINSIVLSLHKEVTKYRLLFTVLYQAIKLTLPGSLLNEPIPIHSLRHRASNNILRSSPPLDYSLQRFSVPPSLPCHHFIRNAKANQAKTTHFAIINKSQRSCRVQRQISFRSVTETCQTLGHADTLPVNRKASFKRKREGKLTRGFTVAWYMLTWLRKLGCMQGSLRNLDRSLKARARLYTASLRIADSHWLTWKRRWLCDSTAFRDGDEIIKLVSSGK